jgi:hypothetical protein
VSTLQDILTDIDARLPNTFTNAQKVGWMQDKLNEIWPHVALVDSFEFDTVANQYVYVLPEYTKVQYIDSVVISADTGDFIDQSTVWHEYAYQRPNITLAGYKYYDILGSLGISPVPDQSGYKASVLFRKIPIQLNADDLDAPFDFDDELVHIFKYEVMRIISESPPYESAARAAYFNTKVQDIYELILERELRYKLKTGNKAKPNSWWCRR